MYLTRSIFSSTTELTSSKAIVLLYKSGFNFKSKWSLFTRVLNVPLEQMEKMRAIIKEDEIYEYAIEIALDWWIKNTSEASWKELILSVDMCGEKDAADTMRKTLSEESKYFCIIITISCIILDMIGDKVL